MHVLYCEITEPSTFSQARPNKFAVSHSKNLMFVMRARGLITHARNITHDIIQLGDACVAVRATKLLF